MEAIESQNIQPESRGAGRSCLTGCLVVFAAASVTCLVLSLAVGVYFRQSIQAFAYLVSGTISADKGDYQAAIQQYNDALQAGPIEAIATIIYTYRGMAYADTSNQDQALADFNQAIQLCPCSGDKFVNRGSIYLENGMPDMAIGDFNQALQLPLDFPSGTYYLRGQAYARKGQPAQAITDFDLAIKLYPTYPISFSFSITRDDLLPWSFDIYHARGTAYLQQDGYVRALADFEQAIALKPDHAPAYGGRCQAYFGLKEYEKALADCNTALKLAPHDVATLYARAQVLIALGRTAEAAADLQDVASQAADAGLAQKAKKEYQTLQTNP